MEVRIFIKNIEKEVKNRDFMMILWVFKEIFGVLRDYCDKMFENLNFCNEIFELFLNY